MYLLFDIGGTNTRLGISKNGKKIDAVTIFPSEKKFSDEIKLIQKKAQELAGGKKIVAAAGGIASPLNKQKDRMIFYPNGLPSWKGKAVKKELEKVLKTKVFLENDCVMVGLGEMHYGAGKGKRIGGYITISSGVGGARFVDGRPDESASGFEPGGQYVSFGKKPIILEDVISGVALEKRFGKKANSIEDKKVWEEETRLIALGLNNAIVQWSPDVIVLGGSIMKRISIDRLKFYLKKFGRKFSILPTIKKATLGDIGGLYGALHYLNNLKK